MNRYWTEKSTDEFGQCKDVVCGIQCSFSLIQNIFIEVDNLLVLRHTNLDEMNEQTDIKSTIIVENCNNVSLYV